MPVGHFMLLTRYSCIEVLIMSRHIWIARRPAEAILQTGSTDLPKSESPNTELISDDSYAVLSKQVEGISLRESHNPLLDFEGYFSSLDGLEEEVAKSSCL